MHTTFAGQLASSVRFLFKSSSRFAFKFSIRFSFKSSIRFPFKSSVRFPFKSSIRFPFKSSIRFPFKSSVRFPFKSAGRLGVTMTPIPAPNSRASCVYLSSRIIINSWPRNQSAENSAKCKWGFDVYNATRSMGNHHGNEQSTTMLSWLFRLLTAFLIRIVFKDVGAPVTAEAPRALRG